MIVPGRAPAPPTSTLGEFSPPLTSPVRNMRIDGSTPGLLVRTIAVPTSGQRVPGGGSMRPNRFVRLAVALFAPLLVAGVVVAQAGTALADGGHHSKVLYVSPNAK